MPAAAKKLKPQPLTVTTPDEPQHSVKEFYHAEDVISVTQDPVKQEHEMKEECKKLRTMLDRLATATDDQEKSELRDQISLCIMSMRRFNRMTHVRNRHVKDEATQERQKSDEQYLKLQNLVHEVQHLQKEMTKCLEFKSADEIIDLVPLEQFYKDAPAEISKPEVTKKSKHDLKKARLEWELKERQLFKQRLQTLKKQDEILNRKMGLISTKLSSIKQNVETVLMAAKPLQEMLGKNYEHEGKQNLMAASLVPALNYLYLQIVCYKDIFDKSVSIEIKGDLPAAQSDQADVPQSAVDSEDSADEGAAEEETTTRKGKRKRRPTVTEAVEMVKHKVLDIAPLWLEAKIPCPGDLIVHLSFFYLKELDVVSSKTKIEFKENIVRALASAGNLLADETILQDLYDGDGGTVCPNLSGRKKLEYFEIEIANEVAQAGHVYGWAQRLAGLNFIQSEKEPHSDMKELDFLQQVLERIKHRVHARLALQQQIAILEQNRIPHVKQLADWFPTKVLSRLTSWKSLTADDFKCHPATQTILESLSVSVDGWFFSATIERAEAKLMALIHVSPAYPLQAPLFVLVLKWKGTKPATESHALRCLEESVNMGCTVRVPRKQFNHLLSVQLQFLVSRLDILLEVECARSGLKDFARDHLFGRKSRGPDRQMPLEFSESSNSFFFD